MFLLSAVLMMAMQTIPDMTMVEVKEGPKGCEYRAEGRRMTQQQLEHRARTWARQGRRIEVHGTRDISYRCIGGVMDLEAHRHGLERADVSPPQDVESLRLEEASELVLQGVACGVELLPAGEEARQVE